MRRPIISAVLAVGLALTGAIAGNSAPDSSSHVSSSPETSTVIQDNLKLQRSTLESGGALEPSRIFGEDRYSTAAEISSAWQPGVSTVFIASGEVYPDALTAGSRAANINAPVLLVRSNHLPNATASALARLNPAKIVIVGGESSVSPTVASQLVPFAGTGAVERLSGHDRYATAASVASLYPTGQAHVYLASGEVFADALAVAALAGAEGAPLLLTRKTGLDASTVAQIERLAAEQVIVVGGPVTVPDSVARQAAELTSTKTFERVGGADRYETAALVAARIDVSGGSAFIASGVVFPDALAGAALAANAGAPVLLTPTDHAAQVTLGSLREQTPEEVVVLGGPLTITDNVVDQISRELHPGYLEGWGWPAYSDEFDYRNPQTGEPELDPAKWNKRPRSDLGLTFDAAETRNEQIVVDDDGILHIYGEWMDEPKSSGRSSGIMWLTHWTGYIDHRPLREGDFTYEQVYGRWEIRARVPTSPRTLGSLPAFWLRNHQSGEIDIMEAWGYNVDAAPGGQRIDTATTTVHTHTSNPSLNQKYIWHHEDYGAATPVWEDFHVYAFELTPDYAAIFFDGDELVRVTPTTHPNLWDDRYFGTPLHVRLNMHIGPSEMYWGLPDPDNRHWTQDNLDYAIDYVRIYPYGDQ